MTEVKPDISQSLLLQALEQISMLDGKIGVVQGQNNIIIADQAQAAQGRQKIYEKLNKIDVMSATMDRIVPLVDKHEARHNKTQGAMSLGRVLWGMSAGAIGAGITMLLQWFAGGRSHP